MQLGLPDGFAQPQGNAELAHGRGIHGIAHRTEHEQLRSACAVAAADLARHAQAVHSRHVHVEDQCPETIRRLRKHLECARTVPYTDRIRAGSPALMVKNLAVGGVVVHHQDAHARGQRVTAYRGCALRDVQVQGK